MTAELQKQELIFWISRLDDKALLDAMLGLKNAAALPNPPARSRRKAGWGKSIFLRVAPDFDETPPGFEDYMPA